MFDIYSEENYDSVLKEANFLQVFTDSKPALEQKVREAESSHEEEELASFAETMENLDGFLAYKQERL